MMEFVAVERTTGEPYRDRDAITDAWSFESRSGTVLVARDVAIALRQRVVQAQPKETGGLLCGRVFVDRKGPYTVVLAAVEAEQAETTASHIHMSAGVTAELRRRASRSYPAFDVIGWWHGHSGPFGYSATDFATQRMWSDPQHVGLLVYARGPWGVAYLGPSSSVIPPPPELSEPTRELLPPVAERPSRSAPEMLGAHDKRASRTAMMWIAVVAVAIASVSALLGAASATRTSPEKPPRWTCQADPAGPVHCATADGASVHWLLDAVVAGQGPTVVLNASPGPHVVAALDGSGPLEYAVVEFAVPPPPPTTTPPPPPRQERVRGR